MPSPPPASKPAPPLPIKITTTSNYALKSAITSDEPVPKEGVMKKSPSTGEDENIPPKPKKRVMVLENGRLERTGVSVSPTPTELARGAYCLA